MMPLELAETYAKERGWRVIPVPVGSKKPVIDGWQRLELDAADLPTHFAGDANVGLLNGKPSRWQVDVDLDAAEAVEAGRELLPPTDLISGRPSKSLSHWFYRLTAPQETRQYKDVDKSML